ncbi:hypothetical protein QSW43_004236 [Salmonella enterica]|nr:hypothetical protein [Salmonella enterica]
MKKTLIALAVAASAAVSGSAMAAWTASGIGGSVNFGGTLSPIEKVVPWEVKVWDAMTNLDQKIQKGQREVYINLDRAIPIVGIRTSESKAFTGQDGISPQVDFNGKAEVKYVLDGQGTLKIQLHDKVKHEKIGELIAPMLVGAEFSAVGGPHEGLAKMIASKPGEGFYGGLPISTTGLLDSYYSRVSALDSDIVAHFDTQGQSNKDNRADFVDFKGDGVTYSAYYAAGLEKGQRVRIILDKPVESDDVAWEATLPITVSYI